MLGQRDMIRLSCPNGFPSKALGGAAGGDKSPRGAHPTASSIRRQRQSKTVAELLDELSLVGYVDEPDIASIVEPSGKLAVCDVKKNKGSDLLKFPAMHTSKTKIGERKK